MAIAFVGVGTGAAATTGTVTVSKTGCTAGNIIISNLVERGNADDFSKSNYVNTESLEGVAGSLNGIISGSGTVNLQQQVDIGRVVSNGTVSWDLNVGASGNDLFCQIMELSGVSTSHTDGKNTVYENGTQPQARDGFGSSGTSVSFAGVSITTNGADRYAVIVGALSSNQAVTNFTGETGGVDMTQPASAFQSATGATATLWEQTGQAPSITTIDNGSFTVTSTDWVLCTFALIPAPGPAASDDPPIGFSGRGAGW